MVASCLVPGETEPKPGGHSVSRLLPLVVMLASLFAGSGCIRIKTDPIHVIVDVNIRIQKDLDDFFGDLDAADPTVITEKK